MTAAKVAVVSASVQPRKAPNWAAEVGNVWFLKYTPSTSYTASGDAIDIAAALPGQIRGKPILVHLVQNALTGGYTAAYDATAKKVWLWNGTSEASGDQSAKIFDMIVYAP